MIRHALLAWGSHLDAFYVRSRCEVVEGGD